MAKEIESNTPEFEFNKIDEQVTIGTNACCTTHFDEDLIQKEGISADISLEEERVDNPYGVDAYLWLPVTDHTPPSMKQALVGIATLTQMLSQGMKVYIHCKNGHGRAPTFYAAYLIINEKMSADEAIKYILDKRPTAHFENAQQDFLRSLGG